MIKLAQSLLFKYSIFPKSFSINQVANIHLKEDKIGSFKIKYNFGIMDYATKKGRDEKLN